MVREDAPRRGPGHRRGARVDAIVDAALDLVTEGGLEALTMKALAGRLGCAVGAVYRYFPGKDELVLAVQGRVLTGLAADLEAADARLRGRLEGADPGVSALARVIGAAETFARLPRARPAHFALLQRWLMDPAPLVGTAAAAARLPALLALFAEVPARLAEAERAGALAPGPPAAARAHLLWSSLAGVLATAKLARFGVPGLPPRPGLLVDALLQGWGAHPRDLAAARALGVATSSPRELP